MGSGRRYHQRSWRPDSSRIPSTGHAPLGQAIRVPQLVHCLRDEDIIFVRQRAILALLVSLEEPELVPYVEQVSLHLRRRLTEVTHQNFPCLVRW